MTMWKMTATKVVTGQRLPNQSSPDHHRFWEYLAETTGKLLPRCSTAILLRSGAPLDGTILL